MAKRNRPTIERLRQVFLYRDGSLFYQRRPRDHFRDERTWSMWNTTHAGNEAGYPNYNVSGGPRWMVRIDGYVGYRHVIVWSIHNGDWPPLGRYVDHKNGIPIDDQIDNLRLATKSQDGANKKLQRGKESCQFKGVCRQSKGKRWGGGKWRAAIRVKGKAIHLGYFDTPEEAHEVYVEAAKKYFGEFASDGT